MKTPSIVVGTDFSDTSQRAVETAAALAERMGAPLVLVHVHRGFEDFPPEAMRGEFAQGLADRAAEVDRTLRASKLESLEALARSIREKRAITVSAVVATGRPGFALERVAAESEARLLVVGTHGRRPPMNLFLGSVAEQLVRYAGIPVLVVRDRGVAPSGRLRIGVGVAMNEDGNDAAADRVVAFGRSLAGALDAELTFVGVCWPPAFVSRLGLTSLDPGAPDPAIEAYVQRELRSRVGGSEPVVAISSWGRAADALGLFAAERFDLVVVGSRGGSFAVTLSRRSPIPVLAVPVEQKATGR